MRRNFLAISQFLVAICLSMPVQAQERKGLTWAILGDEQSVQSGIAEMLTVKLDAGGFQLLERSELDELEIELQRSLESQSLDASMQSGRRLGARHLIVCQVQREADPPNGVPLNLRVFVCDCDILARIAVADFELSNPVAVIDNVAEWLDSVVISAPIENVVGLAPVACKNLGDEYLDIGKKTQDFLSAQILAIPGVALIEWEQTRALNREVDVTDAAGRRIVPSFITVDYRVIPSSEDTPTLVEVATSVQSTGQALKESTTLPLLEIESWLRSKILPHVLNSSSLGNGISVVNQTQLLKSRVRTLFRLGAVQSSAQVREVILQIDPNDSAERLRLLYDYGQITKISDPKRLTTLYPLRPVEIRARSFQREHFEYLVRNQQLSFAEAIERFPEMVIDPDSRLALDRISPKFNLSQVDLARALGSLEQDLEFVRAVGPAILKLNRENTNTDDVELKRRVAWSQAVLSVARLHTWFNFGSEESRIEVIRLISDVIPEDFPTIELGEWLFDTRTFPKQFVIVSNHGTWPVERFEAGMWAEDLIDFYNKYHNSGHRHVRLYLQYARFRHEHALPMGLHDSFNTQPLENRASIAEIEAELQEIRREALQSTGAEERGLVGPNQHYLDYVLDRVVHYSKELKRQYVDKNRRSRGSPSPMGSELPIPDPEFGRVHFSPIELQVPYLHHDSTVWQADDPSHDLVYDRSLVYRHNAAGDFLLISPEKGYTFIDDELVWLLERGESHEVRVYANDRQGRNVLVGETLALPPYDDFKVTGSGKGKGIIIGWFDGGTWCGQIERGGDRLAFRVFHEAREYSSSTVAEEVVKASKSAKMRFMPRWSVRGHDGKGDCLLVGRLGMTPLRIDVSTLSVKVMPMERADFLVGAKIANEKFYQSMYGFVFEYDLNSLRSSIPHEMVIGMDQLEQNELGHATAGNQQGTLIVEGDWLIYPGFAWYRYNLKTGLTERLVTTRLPGPFATGMVGKSSIHGIVHWQQSEDGGIAQISQVTIEDRSSAADLSGRVDTGQVDTALGSSPALAGYAVKVLLFCLILVVGTGLLLSVFYLVAR